jgi:hypothetical protein
MKLENFEVHSSIELKTGNLFWDLHNLADFRGLELIVSENTLVMRWTVPAVANPWGCYENKFSGMALHFRNLQFLNIGGRDGDMPLTEDTCISHVIKVDPSLQNVELYKRTRRDWKPADSFRLLFRFQSGRVIEIESEAAELIPLP